MSTQESKFRLFNRLREMGFTYEESVALRRIEMTLQRWSEQECGDGNEYGSWAIERDEATGKPFRVHHHYLHGRGKDYVTRYAIADREAGALRRLKAIIDARNSRKPFGSENLLAYHQSDPRGCALYILTESMAPAGRVDAETNYTRGLAVCA